MVIFAISISIRLGRQLEPRALQYVPPMLKVLLAFGLLPAAFIAIFLNLILPQKLREKEADEALGGLSGKD